MQKLKDQGVVTFIRPVEPSATGIKMEPNDGVKLSRSYLELNQATINQSRGMFLKLSKRLYGFLMKYQAIKDLY